MKIPESKYLVRFPDCDPYHHLNNARYLDYFINAREDHLNTSYGFDIHRFTREHKLGWMVTQHQIAYLRPASLMEQVVIQSCILSMGTSDIRVEMTMWNDEKTHVKALLWTVFTHVNLANGKREQHSETLMQQFGPLEVPLPGGASFEERAKELKTATAIG